MNTSTDRSHDVFSSAEKSRAREHTLEQLRQQHVLWGADDRLRGSWCELVGETGIDTKAMLEKSGAIGPGGFVGVDFDAARIARFRKKYPKHVWISGDIRYNVERLITIPQPIAVLHLDGYWEVGSREVVPLIAAMKPVIEHSWASIGSFALFVTCSLSTVQTWRHKKPSDVLKTHTECVLEVLNGCVPRRGVLLEDLLPKGFERFANGTVEGACGAYYFYKGNQVRMVKMGVLL